MRRPGNGTTSCTRWSCRRGTTCRRWCRRTGICSAGSRGSATTASSATCSEPLGLLRFAGVRDLHRLFASRFAGLGEPGTLVAYLAGSEYQIRDHEYGLFYHTFRYQDEIAPEEVLAENETKVRYLARKLTEDLEDGEKIFVYRRFVEDDLSTVAELHRVLRGYGPVKLLWVTTGAPGRSPGDVEWAGPDLLRGYLAGDADNDPSVFDPEHWIGLLRNAFQAFGRIGRERMS